MTISIELALRSLLLDSAEIAAVIGDRIAPVMNAGETVFPRAVYTRFSSDHQSHLLGASGFLFARVQIDLFAATALELVSLADLFRNRLDGYVGTVTVGSESIRLKSVRLTDERTDGSSPTDGSDAGVYRHLLDFEISAFESLPTLT